MSRNTTRRNFLKSSSAVGASFLITGTKASGNILGANDRVRIGVVGVNGRGSSHISGFGGQKNVELAYLVDPDSNVLERRLKSVKEKEEHRNCEGEKDIRKILEDKTLDAISIAAPNHWHSLMTIWGAQAGKHVYVEKPMSHDITEGRVASEAQKKYGVVVQHGTQNRSSSGVAGLSKAVRDGKFGKLKISYGYCCKPRGGIGTKSPGAPPSHLDWDLWKGPAVVDQYHGNYVHYNWHWFWETGNGDLNNQGTHQLDVAYWAIDEDQVHPVKATAIGGRFLWDDQGQTPNTMLGMAEYPNGQVVMFNVRNVNYKGYDRQVENEYYFEDGGKIIRGQYYPKGSSKGEKVSVPGGDVTPGGNWGSFIAAIRAGDPSMANGNAEVAHRSCVLGHLMNNSYRLGSEVPFNAKAGGFAEHPLAGEHFLKLHEIMNKGCGVEEGKAKYTVGPMLTFDPETERHTGEHADAANALLKNENNPGFVVPDVKDV
ncbi:MAG: Gfo/Idh/MocA family oxidoreductase [Pirellulaceae bacterium]